jgi:hypothetical protein
MLGGASGREAPGDCILQGTRGALAGQLARVSAAQSRLSSSSTGSAAAQTQPASSGIAAQLSDDWWRRLMASVPGDRVDLLRSYMGQHEGGRLSSASLCTRARVLLVDSVTSTARTAAGGMVASKAQREDLVAELVAVGGSEQ